MQGREAGGHPCTGEQLVLGGQRPGGGGPLRPPLPAAAWLMLVQDRARTPTRPAAARHRARPHGPPSWHPAPAHCRPRPLRYWLPVAQTPPEHAPPPREPPERGMGFGIHCCRPRGHCPCGGTKPGGGGKSEGAALVQEHRDSPSSLPVWGRLPAAASRPQEGRAVPGSAAPQCPPSARLSQGSSTAPATPGHPPGTLDPSPGQIRAVPAPHNAVAVARWGGGTSPPAPPPQLLPWPRASPHPQQHRAGLHGGRT